MLMYLQLSLISCYLLTKGANGVKAKFVGTSMLGPKKNVIWVPKSLVTNFQGPKYIIRIDVLCRSIIKPEEGIGCLIVGAHNIWLMIQECLIQSTPVVAMVMIVSHLVTIAKARSKGFVNIQSD